MSGSRGSHGEGPTSRRATQADGILLAAPKQQVDANDWRSRGQLEPATPSTSPSYWSDDDTEPGVKPTDLYGKFTWKIENFTEISKRELRSNVFEVGNFKWYILVYPHGCDVCNHLSLFLCVADYDKLLPGWSHFAQFTIAVVNKDPKKSKYSDTLHRFCKKEHDWGWKKFMERSKIGDGFTVADTLVIKAQVQVIKEAVGRPFRCLDSQYRRELVRVYLTNVEGICRRFVEEKREKLSKLVSDEVRFASFRAFWAGIKESQRKGLSCEKTDTILKSVVKKFFNEKEVTSTLVMDALFSGTKSLERGYKVRAGQEEWGTPTVWLDKEYFVLSADVLTVLDRAVHEPIPAYKDDKGSGTPHRVKESGLDDMGRDSVERDERRLQELGRRTVEMFVLSHLFSNRVEVAYREAVALKRQEELIREEEEAEKQAAERVERETADKEKKQSKKQKAKQRKKDRLQKEEDERRARVELEQRAKIEKEIERKAARAPVPSVPAPEDEDTESDETSQEDADDELDEGEMSDEEEPGTLGEVAGTLVDDQEEEEEEETAPEADEDEGPGPATVEDAEEEEDEWQEAEPAFRAVTVEATVVTVGRSRRRRNKKKKGADSNEVVGGAGPLPVPVVVEAPKQADEVSSSGSVESTVLKGVPNGGGMGPQDAEKQSEEQSKRPSGSATTPPLMDGLELEERVASAGGAGMPSSSGTEEYDSHEAEAIIASLRERVSWLEDRLQEKEDEVVVLQEQLRQQALPNGLPSVAPVSRPSSALSRTSSNAASAGPVNAAVAPKTPAHGLSRQPTGPPVRGVVTPPQQAMARGASAYPRPALGNRPATPGSARDDPPAAASAAAAAAAAALLRPTSAPGAGPLLRHISGPVASIANPPAEAPQLARSLSNAAPGGSARVQDRSPPEQPAAPVAPSYRNAAAGKIRGATPAPLAAPSSSAPPPSSLAAFPPIGQPPQIVTQQGGSSRSSSSQPSPPVTPSSEQESPSSTPPTPRKSAPGQEQAAAKEQPPVGGGVPGKRGAVYAPPMHAASLERTPSGGNESGGAPNAETAQPDGKGIKFGSVTADVLPPRSPRARPSGSVSGGQDQQAQPQGGQRAQQPAVGVTPPHAARGAAGAGQPHMDSPGLSEDFPHLSLINDLLDDDLLGMGGLVANGNAGQSQQGGYNAAHSRIPPQILARKLHPGASPFSPASDANRAEGERGSSGAGPQANGLSHHQQKPQQAGSQQGPSQHHYQQHPGNSNAGTSGMVGGAHKNGPPEYASAGGMQRAQQLRHTRSLPPGVADGLLSNGHMGHPPMYWVPNSGAYPPPGMHGVNGPMLDKNGLQASGVPPGYQMTHANYGQFAPPQQPLPSQHQ